MDALKLKWRHISHGGSWDILSVEDDIIAVEIPYGAYADHIVNLHNRSLDLKTASKKNSKTPHTRGSCWCGVTHSFDDFL